MDIGHTSFNGINKQVTPLLLVLIDTGDTSFTGSDGHKPQLELKDKEAIPTSVWLAGTCHTYLTGLNGHKPHWTGLTYFSKPG